MSKFSRSASWLKQLYTPSSTGWREPGQLSPDVSLTSPYDGGAYPLLDPSQWLLGAVVSATVAAGSTTLFTVPVTEIARVLAVSATVTAGVAPQLQLQVRTLANDNVIVSESVLAVAAIRTGIQVFTPIVGPGHLIIGRHTAGDAATIVSWDLYVARAPLGSVFYV